MFAMYEWLPQSLTPKHINLYNKTKKDVAFTALVRQRLVDEFMWNGIVPKWSKYNQGHNNVEAMNVAVLNVENEHMLQGWRQEQCELFMKEGYYETKVWVN